jgi:hypothetical protein
MGLGLFIVMFMLWILVPLCIATWLAVERDESVTIAIVLTLFLGWVGLAIVYVGQQNSRAAVEGLAQRAASPPSTYPPPPLAAEPPIEERLTRLDRMHADGLLSDEEHQEQRRRILNSL